VLPRGKSRNRYLKEFNPSTGKGCVGRTLASRAATMFFALAEGGNALQPAFRLWEHPTGQSNRPRVRCCEVPMAAFACRTLCGVRAMGGFGGKAVRAGSETDNSNVASTPIGERPRAPWNVNLNLVESAFCVHRLRQKCLRRFLRSGLRSLLVLRFCISVRGAACAGGAALFENVTSPGPGRRHSVSELLSLEAA
jgi:hypothetical protein